MQPHTDPFDLRLIRFRNAPQCDEPTMLVMDLLRADRLHDALQVLDHALATDPDDVDLLLGCGLAAKTAGHMSFAQWALTMAASKGKAWHAPLAELTKVLRDRGKDHQAIQLARRAVTAGSEDPDVVAMLREADRGAALDAKLAAFVADPGSLDPALLAAELLDAKRIDDVTRVSRLASDDPDVQWIDAQARFSIGDRAGAQHAAQAAVDLAGDWKPPALFLVERLVEGGLWSEAWQAIEQLRSLHSTDAEVERLHDHVGREVRARGLLGDQPDVALDAALAQLDHLDPIGDATRAKMMTRDTAVDLAAPVPVKPRTNTKRTGWLPPPVKRWFWTAKTERIESTKPAQRAGLQRPSRGGA